MTIGAALHLAFAIVHLGVVVLALRDRTVAGARIVAAVAVLLVADNLIIAGGVLVGEGTLLESLSLLRFVGHVVVTPLLVMAVRSLAEECRIDRAARPAVRALAIVLTVGLIALGVVTDLVDLDLVPILEGGVLRYHDPAGGAPVAAIVTLIVVLALAWPMARRAAGPGALVGGIVMFVASALDPVAQGPTLGNAGEVALLLGLTLGVRGVSRADVPDPVARR